MSNADRSEIEILKERGYSIREIAKTLRRHISGIWYELQKKRKEKSYDAQYAKHLSYVRMRGKRVVGKKIALDPALRAFVETHLFDDQSPDAIAGRIRRVAKNLPRISARAIRRYIRSVYGRRIESHRAKLFKPRRKGGRKKGVLDGRRLITKRPRKINERKGIGNMEGDFIVSGKSGKGLGLALIDRNMRKVLVEKIFPVSVRNVERALLGMKKRFPEMKTITFDNDLLFLEHKRLEKKLGIKIYFCHPRSPWEKPSVENFNKWLRRYIPKSSDISKYSRYVFKQLEAKANRRFMECLGFQTPDEKYAQALQRKERRAARSKEKTKCSN